MARLHDDRGKLLGGLSTRTQETMQASPQSRMGTPYAPKYGGEETVTGLTCDYGSLAYSSPGTPLDTDNVATQSRRRRCHNSVETADERHHCDTCGGDYCTSHAEGAAHDCTLLVHSA